MFVPNLKSNEKFEEITLAAHCLICTDSRRNNRYYGASAFFKLPECPALQTGTK